MKQHCSIPVLKYIFILLLLGAAAFSSGGQTLHETPPWKEEMAKGYFPYHRLVASDFPINDHVHPENGMYTMGFFRYRYKDHWIAQNGHTVDRVTEWLVWSGFDRNKSSRKSWFKRIDETLPHEQGHLDINELYSRQLAEMPLEKLPIGEGASPQEARADLTRKLHALADDITAKEKTEQDRYDAETSHGKNVSEQEKMVRRDSSAFKTSRHPFLSAWNTEHSTPMLLTKRCRRPLSGEKICI